MISRQVTSVVAAGILIGVGALVQPTAAAAAPAAPCTVARPDTARLGTALTTDGGPAYAQWLEQGAVPAANLATQRATHQQFGIGDEKVSIATLAERGLLGSAIDHNTRTVAVVVTPEYASKAAALQRTMTAALPASLGATTLRTAVVVGCYSGAKVAAADRLLQGRAWHPAAAKATFSYHLDAADSRLHVAFDPADAAAADAARAALGDLGVVTLTGSARAGRLDDGRPHYGGAGLRVNSGGINTNICTSTFAVRRNSDGLRGGLTAAHCFTNGNAIYSSTKFWGTAWGEANYPAFDMMGVASAAETYDNQIHVDPCCPSTRNVTSKRAPVVGDSVCLSGMVTRAICGLLVSSISGSVCDADGCTNGLMQARRANDVTVRGGDSGGPVYQRSGSANAVAMGLIVGFNDGGRNAFAERLGAIESHLGVTVLTS